MAFDTVCVIGAGISGLTVASELSAAGLDVSLVEKNAYPGGQAIHYGCKATESCVHCAVCLVRNSVAAFKSNHELANYFSSVPRACRANGGGEYEIEIESKPNAIDWKTCNECGRCLEICPEEAVQLIPGWRYVINENCTRCGKCVEACPTQAIQLAREAKIETITASTVVVATGFQPFDPKINRKWGYGASPRVITGSDLERLFFREKYLPFEAKSLAFIQCVGSRSTHEGERHCSRVCCAYALRMANRLKSEFPDTQIDFYYMDIQYFGKNFEEFWGEVGGKLNFIQSNPIAVRTDGSGRPIVRYESLSDQSCKEQAYDLVVLSNGICPASETEQVADLFNLDLAPDGFLHPLESGAAGGARFFSAGTCKRPMRIDECVDDALLVSNRVLRHLGVKI